LFAQNIGWTPNRAPTVALTWSPLDNKEGAFIVA
jgi:hypothetical protein